MDDEVVDVDDNVGEAVDHGLDEPLEGCGASEEPHAGRDPLELPQARQREGREQSGFGVEQHLPEAGSQIEGRKNNGI